MVGKPEVGRSGPKFVPSIQNDVLYDFPAFWQSLRVLYVVVKPNHARLAGLEPEAVCLEGTQYKTLSAASGVAYEEARHSSRS
jgi:hypothetical protein